MPSKSHVAAPRARALTASQVEELHAISVVRRGLVTAAAHDLVDHRVLRLGEVRGELLRRVLEPSVLHQVEQVAVRVHLLGGVAAGAVDLGEREPDLGVQCLDRRD